MMRCAIFAGLLAAASPVAVAQVASVITTDNGGSSATIEPGGVVTISVQVAHNSFAFGLIQGGTVIDGNAGVNSNFSTIVPNYPTVYFGQIVGGSRTGAESGIGMDPMGSPMVPGHVNPLQLWRYDVILADAGEYEVVWVPWATGPNVWLWTAPHGFSLR